MQMERESGKPDPPPVPRSRNGGGAKAKASKSFRFSAPGDQREYGVCVTDSTFVLSFGLRCGSPSVHISPKTTTWKSLSGASSSVLE